MTRFGLVAEGGTDQVVLDSIITGFLEDEDDPEINHVQPVYDRTGALAYGGWGLVIGWLRAHEYRRALQTNDFVVVQIDTDVSEQVGYGVSWKHNGHDRTPAELVAAVIAKLVALIDPDFYRQYADRFIFAVAVHEIECWLLPLLYDNRKASKIAGCLEAANNELRKSDRAPLLKGEEKQFREYQSVSKAFQRKKVLLAHKDRNPSLSCFIDELTRKLHPDPMLKANASPSVDGGSTAGAAAKSEPFATSEPTPPISSDAISPDDSTKT